MSNVRAARPSKSGSWTLNLYAEAGEGGGCYVPLVRPEPTGRGSDPARAELEAVRRARGKVRRYAATHRLNRFVTLTYAGEGCFDPLELRRHVGEPTAWCMRRCRSGVWRERGWRGVVGQCIYARGV
jgi:hypothetical protein